MPPLTPAILAGEKHVVNAQIPALRSPGSVRGPSAKTAHVTVMEGMSC